MAIVHRALNRALIALCAVALPLSAADWLEWRGPNQNGVSDEKGLPDTWEPGGKNHLWSVDLAGRGTPVIRGERVYVFGYRGEGQNLQEVLACLDAATGKTIWEHAHNDFLSDIIYDRYAIASPTIDGETGNVYVVTSAGLLLAYDADGKPLWDHALMEEIGRMTFPNGRNGAPSIHRNLVIIHCMTANWGGYGPAQDRFYAFNKKSGALVWISSPGVRPKDNSFSRPVFTTLGDREVFYCGTGCGNVVCIDANTGEAVWRFPFSVGGVNASVSLYGGDKLIAMHGKENLDSTDSGRLIALGRSQTPEPQKEGTPILGKSAELWRNNDAICYTSSPVLVGDRIYLTTETGELAAVDATTGKTLWKEKLGIEQLHASPLYADGKLYVPIKDHTFAIVRPTDAKAEVLCKVDVGGECNGAPSVANGRVYLFTTTKLFCFGAVKPGQPDPYVKPKLSTGPVAKLMPVPGEVLLRPGAKATIGLTALDTHGIPVAAMPDGVPSWSPYVPPTAKVRALLGASFPDVATILAAPEPRPTAGMFEVTIGQSKGYLRGRVLPHLPIKVDFENIEVAVDHELEQGVKFAYPPLPWIGARFKWEVREIDGADGMKTKALVKTIDNKLFQRSTTFVGAPDAKDYTIEADVMSEGNKRKMSEVGIVNQRYAVILKGNAQELEINSNLERIRVAVPFPWKAKEWYRLKARVDVAADGSGVVRAKAWKKGDPEPEKWTLEVPHAKAHQNGAPGFFGFSPTDMRVFIDNLTVTPNATPNAK
jgi:outer membrane protein assembly factor BamB